MYSVLFVSCLFVLVAADPLAEIPDRNPKFLSLFQTIKFENAACNGTGTEKGACYTAAECTSNKGASVGKCAEGFGVCCKITAGCDGGNKKLNLTYFESKFTEKNQCKFDITADDNIAMIRLDFEEFNLAQPDPTSGACLDDKFMTTGLEICGDAKGQHYYLPYAKDKVQLIVNGQKKFDARKFKIKVSLIEKDNPCLPPTGCQQYYYEKTMGTIKSFNYKTEALTATAGTPATRQLIKQDIRVCFRKGEDMCSISYKMCETTDNSFTLTGNAQVATKDKLIGNANLGPTPSTATGRRRRDIDFRSMFALGHFRQARAGTITTNIACENTPAGKQCDDTAGFPTCVTTASGAVCYPSATVACGGAGAAVAAKCEATVVVDADCVASGFCGGGAQCVTTAGAICLGAPGTALCATTNKGKCVCKGTYTTKGTECESKAGESECGGDSDCTGTEQECDLPPAANTVPKCKCKTGSPDASGACSPAVTLATVCATSATCTATSEECKDKVCVCASDYEAQGTVCVRKLGVTCTALSTDECAGTGQECPAAAKCACTATYKELSGKCVLIETTDTACTAENALTTCGAATVAKCTGAKCVCEPAYQNNADKTKCVLRFGGACTEAAPCGGANQVCGTGATCECNAYAKNEDGKCILDSSKFPYGVGDCGFSSSPDYIKIPCPTGGTTKPTVCYGDKFCGTILNMYTFTQSPKNIAPQTLKSFVTPFALDYHTNDKEEAGELGNAGYCLDYDQDMCSKSG